MYAIYIYIYIYIYYVCYLSIYMNIYIYIYVYIYIYIYIYGRDCLKEITRLLFPLGFPGEVYLRKKIDDKKRSSIKERRTLFE